MAEPCGALAWWSSALTGGLSFDAKASWRWDPDSGDEELTATLDREQSAAGSAQLLGGEVVAPMLRGMEAS